MVSGSSLSSHHSPFRHRLSGAGWEDTMWRARGGCVVLFFALLQIRLPLPAALAVNGTVERVWLTSCRRDADCPSRRMACNAGWPVPAGGSVCQCSRWLYTSEAPRCKTLNAVRHNDLMTCIIPTPASSTPLCASHEASPGLRGGPARSGRLGLTSLNDARASVDPSALAGTLGWNLGCLLQMLIVALVHVPLCAVRRCWHRAPLQ